MQKIFFHSSPASIAKSRGGGKLLNGCFYSRATSINDLKASFAQTGNKGNMVHSEAPLKLFKHNLSRSCVGSLVQVRDELKDDFPRYMKENFDLIILSLANFIRKNQDHSKIVEALKSVEVPVIVFSAGLQDRLSSLDNLSSSTVDLLKFLNDKAILFSVRGEETSAFLKSAGMNNHVICGCPSLYVYPENILSIKPLSYKPDLLLSTAGHFSSINLTSKTSKSGRARALLSMLSFFKADYIFQDEIFSYEEFLDEETFDDARQKFYAGIINDNLKKYYDIDVDIEDWYFFNDVSSWRQYMAGRDLYIGDRFHGGVVALQSAVPSVIISGDLRVKELTQFFGIPNASFADFREFGVESVVNEKLGAAEMGMFKEKYVTRLSEFRSACLNVGLNFA